MPEEIGLSLDILEALLNILEFLALIASIITFFVLMLNQFYRALKKLLAPYRLGFWTRIRVLVLCRRSPLKKRAFLEFALLKTGGRGISSSQWQTLINEFKTHYTEDGKGLVYVLENCMPLLGEPFAEAVRAYFRFFDNAKVRKAFGMQEGDVLHWVTKLRIEEAYATPTCLLTGLLARYEENWEDFIGRYVSTAYITDTDESGETRILSNELYMTFAWLLWGPSYELEYIRYWSGLCQLSFGDESNSVPAIAAPSVAPAVAERFQANVGRRYGELMTTDLTVYEGEEYLKELRAGILPEEVYFYEKIKEQVPFVLQIDAFAPREGYKAKKYYCTAYVWILFELEDEERYDFQPENSLAFFEHANLTDMSVYQFLTDTLLNKSILHFERVFSDPKYAQRKYRFVCAFNKDIERKFVEAYQRRAEAGDELASAFAERVILHPKRLPADAFAAYDAFFSRKSQYHYTEVNLADRGTITDLATFYTEIYMECFPDPDERESFDNLLRYLKKAEGEKAYSYHIVLAKDGDGTIIAGGIFDYFKHSNCGVIEFIAVRQSLQSSGIGSAVFRHMFSVLSGDSFKNGKKKLDYVFCEIEDPAVNQVPVKKYLHFWEKYKFRRIDMQYIQPALSGVQKPVHGLWLTVSASNGIADEIPVDVVLNVIADYMRYAMGIAVPACNEEYQKMARELSANASVRLLPLIGE